MIAAVQALARGPRPAERRAQPDADAQPRRRSRSRRALLRRRSRRQTTTGLQIAISALGIASALAFLLGLSPPEIVRTHLAPPGAGTRPRRDRRADGRDDTGGDRRERAAGDDEARRSTRRSSCSTPRASVIASHGAQRPSASRGRRRRCRLEIPGGCLIVVAGPVRAVLRKRRDRAPPLARRPHRAGARPGPALRPRAGAADRARAGRRDEDELHRPRRARAAHAR